MKKHHPLEAKVKESLLKYEGRVEKEEWEISFRKIKQKYWSMKVWEWEDAECKLIYGIELAKEEKMMGERKGRIVNEGRRNGRKEETLIAGELYNFWKSVIYKMSNLKQII